MNSFKIAAQQSGPVGGGLATFRYQDEETGHFVFFSMDQERFNLLGEPEVVTITVESGRTLPDDVDAVESFREPQDHYRSAETGQFVTEGEALESPGTTIHES